MDALISLAPLLCFEAEGRNRARLEAPQTYLLACLVTVAIRSVFDALECLLYLSEKLSLAIPRSKLEFEVRCLAGAIAKISIMGGVVSEVVHRSLGFRDEFASPMLKPAPEVS